jgi:tetratricopeptide (TPR) repeat protein
MKLATFILTLVLAVAPAVAQRHKLTINAETPEGQLLQQIGQESDPGKKLTLLEQFVSQYPKHEAIGWVYAQMVPAYAKANQPGKALDAGEKLLAIDPEDVESAHACLKVAEAQKDPDLIKKWAIITSDAARKVAQSKKPDDEDEEAEWKRRVDFAKQVDVYTEYSLYAAALQTTDPNKKIELADTLQARNAESQYLPKLNSQLFLAYRQLGDTEKAVAVAEKTLETNPNDEDMLLAVTDYYFNKKKDPEKVLSNSAKLVEVLNTKPQPEGVSAADWEKKKNMTLGLAHWMAGVTYSNQSKYVDADKSLREALPHVKDNQQLLAAALFHLGLANFRLGDKGGDSKRIIDALRFNEQCAAIKSPFQAQARKNITAIKSQYRIK